ncbi:Endonuclease/exonuclease/phosphatase [Pelagophyceae sp. CCMP2097]|nr:Endonuclease/exonuclease/phosphatase [Pelagophyceae sp. CCMP2097]
MITSLAATVRGAAADAVRGAAGFDCFDDAAATIGRLQRPPAAKCAMTGWLVKSRIISNSSAPHRTTRRWFMLDSKARPETRLLWCDAEDGGVRGEESAKGATLDHPSPCMFEISFASGRRDELRADTPEECERWVASLREAAGHSSSGSLEARNARQYRPNMSFADEMAAEALIEEETFSRVYTVKKKTKWACLQNRLVEVVAGHLRKMDSKCNVLKEYSLTDLLAVERALGVERQLNLTWRGAKEPYVLIFRTVDNAEDFFKVLRASVAAQSRTVTAVKGFALEAQKNKAWCRRAVLAAREPRWLEWTRFDDSTAPSIEVNVMVCTWNVGNKQPPSDLTAWLHTGRGVPDVIAVGSQECAYPLATKKGDTDFNDSSKKRRTFTAKSDKDDWVRLVAAHLVVMGYSLLEQHHFWQMRLLVFVRREHYASCGAVEGSHKGCGLGDTLGNKGGIGVAFRLYETTLCFVNCHLEAHQAEVAGRNDDYRQIVEALKLGRPGLDIVSQFDYVFFFGDLNYRLDLPQAEALHVLEEFQACWPSARVQGKGKRGSFVPSMAIPGAGADAEGFHDRRRRELMRKLREVDQLDSERLAGRAFYGFEEASDFDFGPTYRYLKQVSEDGRRIYDKAKGRVPSWCDRVLWKSSPSGPPATLVSLAAIDSTPDLTTSDHAPVVANFAILVATSPAAASSAAAQDPPAFVFKDLSAKGDGLAPFHFRKPTRLALRLSGRYLDHAHETDFAASAECLRPKWPRELAVQLVNGTLLASLRRFAVVIELLDRQVAGDTKVEPTVLGATQLGLKEACDAKGDFVAFSVVLTRCGVACGTVSGSLAAVGDLFMQEPKANPSRDASPATPDAKAQDDEPLASPDAEASSNFDDDDDGGDADDAEAEDVFLEPPSPNTRRSTPSSRSSSSAAARQYFPPPPPPFPPPPRLLPPPPPARPLLERQTKFAPPPPPPPFVARIPPRPPPRPPPPARVFQPPPPPPPPRPLSTP